MDTIEGIDLKLNSRSDDRNGFALARKRNLLSPLFCILCCVDSYGNGFQLHTGSLSLYELQNVKFEDRGTLTATEVRKAPAAIRRISNSDIAQSGARDLFELLDIYVPGFQWLRHHFEVKHMGVRGILSDREDKVMIRVNDRVMNERTHIGAISERDFPMMDDIEYIDVIRGAGSAVYGLGAVSMVIDIQTKTAQTYKGGAVNLRYGVGQSFLSLSMQKSFELGTNSGLYLFAGIGDVHGANSNDAPIVFGREFTTVRDRSVALGSSLPHEDNRDGSHYHGRAPIKLHAQFNHNDSTAWVRYTRAGETFANFYPFWAAPPEGFNISGVNRDWGSGNEQFTIALQQSLRFSPDLKLDSMLSYDRTSFERKLVFNEPVRSNHAEEEIFARLKMGWSANEKHEFVIGGELSHERFGLGTGGRELNNDRLTRALSGSPNARSTMIESWRTNTWSILGEWQWRISDKWTTYAGGRIDKTRYSDFLYSPRASVIFTPNDRNAFKLILTQSLRMPFAEESRAADLLGSRQSDEERLRSAEFRYERIEFNTAFLASGYFIELDANGWDPIRRRTVVVGTQKQYGFELELSKEWRNFFVDMNHSFTKLLSHDLVDSGVSLVSAAGNDFGDDLNNWSNHQSKITISYDINSNWGVHSSLRIYWGFPGTKDFVNLKAAQPEIGFLTGDPKFDGQANSQVFLNLGSNYNLNRNFKLHVMAHNVLGLIDSDLNKRNYIDVAGSYRSEAPSLSISLKYEY